MIAVFLNHQLSLLPSHPLGKGTNSLTIDRIRDLRWLLS